jgi:hypothetical protein
MTNENLGSDSNQSSKTTNQEDFSLETLQYTYTAFSISIWDKIGTVSKAG